MQTLQIGMKWFPAQSGSGLDRMYHGLFRHLPDTGVGVRGLVLGDSNQLDRLSSDVHAFASLGDSTVPRLWALRRSVARQLNNGSFDLVASHFSLYSLPFLDLIGPDHPLVFHFHGPWAMESEVEGQGRLKTRLKFIVENVVYRRAHRFIVLSSAFRDLLIQSYDVSPQSVHVVPGGVDIDRFDCTESLATARTRLDWPTDRPIILSVRRLVRRVGLESLVSAMEIVRDRRPDALLLMAGRGPLADELRSQIGAAGLQEHVRLLGFVPDEDLPVAYRAADLTVMPTRALEGFGLSAVESLAAGTPVLVTSVGGLPEIVRDLSDQLIIENDSPAALASRLTAALEGRIDVPSASACQRHARTRFAWPVIASQVKSVYEQVT